MSSYNIPCFFTNGSLKKCFEYHFNYNVQNFVSVSSDFLNSSIFRFYISSDELITEEQSIVKWIRNKCHLFASEYQNQDLEILKIKDLDRCVVVCNDYEYQSYKGLLNQSTLFLKIDSLDEFNSTLKYMYQPVETARYDYVKSNIIWPKMNLPMMKMVIQQPYFFQDHNSPDFQSLMSGTEVAKLYFLNLLIQFWDSFFLINCSNTKNIKIELIFRSYTNWLEFVKEEITLENSYFEKSKDITNYLKESWGKYLSKELLKSTKVDLELICYDNCNNRFWKKPHDRFIISEYFFMFQGIEFNKPESNIIVDTIFAKWQLYRDIENKFNKQFK